RRLVHLVGDLGDDDRRATVALFDPGTTPYPDTAAPGLDGLPDALAAHDSARGEVGPVDVLHDDVGTGLRVLDERQQRVNDLVEVVRRQVGRHADRDTGSAVDDQVRDGRWQDFRFGVAAVVVVAEGDGLLLDVGQQRLGDGGEPRLRVPVGGGGVAV